jgi:hypothetical protein
MFKLLYGRKLIQFFDKKGSLYLFASRKGKYLFLKMFKTFCNANGFHFPAPKQNQNLS